MKKSIAFSSTILAARHLAPYAGSVVAYGASHVHWPQRLAPRLFGLGRAGHVALTFDDGPHDIGTREIMQILDELGWKATFFVVGELVLQRRSLVQEVLDAGHEVAVHGWTHTSFMFKSHCQARRELIESQGLLDDVFSYRPRWFRPPFGTLSGSALSAARAARLEPVLWSSWGRDWSAKSSGEGIYQNVQRGTIAGGTVLLHDGATRRSSGNWRATGNALRMLASYVDHHRLKVGHLSEHISDADVFENAL